MVEPHQQDELPGESGTAIEELARRQGVEPVNTIDCLIPSEPLLDDDERAALLEWLRELRHSEVA